MHNFGRGLLAAAACVLVLGAVAPAAGAATVEIVDNGTEQVLRFEGTAGEANKLAIVSPTAAGGTAYQLTDSGTGVTLASATCSVAGATASCAAAGLDRVEVLLGDGDDEIHVRSADLPLTAQGGDGADTFDDDEVAVGTPARSFAGGPGNDYMRASVTSALLPHDYDGGDGVDSVDYNYRGPNEGGPIVAHAISLDDVANDGVATEGDNVRSNIEFVHGSEGPDTITGTAGNDYVVTNEGADTVDGLGGDDRMYASQGCDADVLTGGEGNDIFHLGGNTKVQGGLGDDHILSDETACPAGSADEANGGDGRDFADFGFVAGALTVSLDDVGNDGLGGLDNFHSDIEDLVAGNGGMTLIGSAAANDLLGGTGNDRLVGGLGPDQLRGGDGIDVADYSARTATVNLSPDGIDNDGETGELDGIWADVENLRGGSGNDTLTGSAADNVLDGGLGSDAIGGGAGVDAVDYSTRTAAVNVTLASGAGNDGEAGEGDTIASDVEGAFGGLGGDTLAGNAGNGVLSGLAGNDKLSDPGGADTLDAGAGDDEVNSVDGAADTVACGAGTDKATSDPVDTVGTDCEPPAAPPVDPPEPPAPTENPGLSPAPGPGGPSTPKPPVAPIDRTAPKATISVPKQGLAKIRSAGLKLTVRTGEAGRIAAKLTAESKTRGVLKRRGIAVKAVLASGRADAAQAGRKALTLRLTRQGRRALRGLSGARLKLVVSVTDRAGNKFTATTHLRVKA